MTAKHLAEVRRSASKSREWTVRRDEAIRAAVAAGHSLGKVAEHAGLSKSAIAKIANRETDR